MAKKNTFMKDLKQHKEGLVIGGLTGAVAAFYLVQGGYDLSTLYDSGRSLIDSLGRNTSVDSLAVKKLYLVLISLGSTLGYMADRLFRRQLMKKKMRTLRNRRRR